MNISRAAIDIDISFSAFEEAVGIIRSEPVFVTLYVTYSAVCLASEIKKKYGCNIVLIPNELAQNNFCWAIMGNDSMYYAIPAK